MEAAKLFLWDMTPAGLWRCSCGDLYRSEEYAERCCTCRYCGQPARDEWGRGLSCEHRDCRKEADRVRDLERIKKAAVEENYDGPVFVEWLGCNDGYFSCMDELLDALDERDDDEEGVPENERTPRPEWAYCCTTERLQLDASHILENAASDLHEDTLECLPRQPVNDLYAAIDAFNKGIAEGGFVTWNADYSRKVPIPAAVKEPTP